MCWFPIQNCANVSQVTARTRCNPEQWLETNLDLSLEKNTVICSCRLAHQLTIHPGVPQFLVLITRARQFI